LAKKALRHLRRLCFAGARYPSPGQTATASHYAFFSPGQLGLRHSTAGSPPHAGRIGFSFLPYEEGFLRTGRSPPAAAHSVSRSRRRSCSRLQVYVKTWRGLSPLQPSQAYCRAGCDRKGPNSAGGGRVPELKLDAPDPEARLEQYKRCGSFLRPVA